MRDTAVVSDIHGNRWALEAVLAHIDRLGIVDIVNLGDTVYGPLDPCGTADILMERGIPTVRGNEDRIITEVGSYESPTLDFVRSSLRTEHFQWLESLEPEMEVNDMLCFHATPCSDTEYLLWNLDSEGAKRKDARDIFTIAGNTAHSIVLCGHDHVPYELTLPDGGLVADPGSVGLQAYTDDSPFPHVMEAGTPDARYSVIHRSHLGIQVKNYAVAYDWVSAAETAVKNHRADWAEWLRTGLARHSALQMKTEESDRE